jgi:hypothetical protein
VAARVSGLASQRHPRRDRRLAQPYCERQCYAAGESREDQGDAKRLPWAPPMVAALRAHYLGRSVVAAKRSARSNHGDGAGNPDLLGEKIRGGGYATRGAGRNARVAA